MKTIYSRILTFGIILTVIMGTFAGCAKDTTAEKTETTVAKEGEKAAEVKTEAVEETMTIAERADELIKTPNIRLVIGSTSTGGDTYQVSSIIAQKLSEILDKNVKVDAVGSTNGFDAIKRTDDGSTIMIFHDQAYLGYLYENEGYSDIFTDYKVGQTIAVNPGNAFSVAKNSPYNTVEDIIEAAGKGEEIRVAIQPGGVSEIGYSAMKNAIKLLYPGMEENLVAVNTGSQADKNQLLFDGQADVINSSVQANEQFNQLPEDDQKAMKFIWLTAKSSTLKEANETGFGDTSREQLLQFVDPIVNVTQDGTNNFTFDKEFFFLYNKDLSDEIVTLFDDALTEAYNDPSLIFTLKQAFFIPQLLTYEEANTYLKEKVGAYEGILESLKK